MLIGVRKPDSILKSNIDFLLSMGIIRKSRGLYHSASGTYMGMGPEAVLGEDHEHLGHTYDEELGLQAHHPVHAHNPETLELEHNLDENGKPRSLHPIDAVKRDLSRLFQRRVNYDAKSADFLAQKAIEGSIGMYNKHHNDDGLHRLPKFDSVQWRRNVVMPYVKSAYAGDRQIRANELHSNGSHYPMGTYHLNSGNPPDAKAKGLWADSGAVVFHEQLGDLLRTWNKDPRPVEEGGLELNLDESVINNLEYVRFPHIGVDKMTDYQVIPADRHHMDGLSSGVPQDQLTTEENVNEAEEAGQHVGRYGVGLAGVHPAFTGPKRKADGSLGNLTGPKSKVEGKEHGRVGRAVTQLEEAGITVAEEGQEPTEGQISAEEFKGLMLAPVSAMMFGAPNETNAQFNKVLLAIEAKLDIDRQSPEYLNIYDNILRAGKRFGGSKGQSEAARRYAAAKTLVGEDAFMAVDYEHPTLPHSEEHHAFSRDLLQRLGDHHGHTAYDYNKPTKDLTPAAQSTEGIHHEIHPDSAWHNNILTAQNLASPGTGRTPQPQQPQPQLQQQQTPLQTRSATPVEQAARVSTAQYTPTEVQNWNKLQGTDMSEFRARREVAAAQPGQSFWDIESQQDPMLVYRSEKDIRNAIDDIQKAMEKIQLQEASVDSSIKKYLPHTPLNSSLDIGLFAKSINLTSHDVWTIHSSKGDWDQLAQDWKVSDTIVKAVKIAMGAIHG